MKAFILNDTRSDKHHGCSIVMANLLKSLEQRSVNVIGTLTCGQRIEHNSLAATAMAQADSIIINGEGTLHHDRPYARYLLETAAAEAKTGKRVFLLNASWESNSISMTALLERFSGIWVRDTSSAKELQQQGIMAITVPDMTFLSRYQEANNKNEQILVTDSVLAGRSKALQGFAQKTGSLYLPIIQHPGLTGENSNWRKWLKTRIYWGLESATFGAIQPRQYYTDLRYCESNTSLYIKNIESAKAMISGRYHATCLALQHVLPLVAIASNTRKVQNLLTDAGLDINRHMIEQEDLISSSMEMLLSRASYSNQEKNALRAFLQSSHQKINSMLDTVARG